MLKHVHNPVAMGFIVLTALMLGAGIYQETCYTECRMIQTTIHNEHSQSSYKQTTFQFEVSDENIDSVIATHIAYETSCVAGSLEENASWEESLATYEQSWEYLNHNKGKQGIQIAIKNMQFVNDCCCETPASYIVRVSTFSNGHQYKEHILKIKERSVENILI